MPVLYPNFTTLAAELGDTIGRTLQKILQSVQKVSVPGTALASAARTVSTISSDIDSAGARGLIVYLNVTAASGTGGLTPRLVAKDPVSGVTSVSAAVSSAATATGLRVYHFAPGVGTLAGMGIGWGAASVQISKTFQLQVLHGDASSYTYSLSYELLP